ncbi:LOW QUALITY PROTEIN: doublesex- and mab-3-related transcription factor C1-like [Dugong dugon]
MAILTSVPGPRTMEPNEIPAVPCCSSDSTTVSEIGAPWGIELVPRRAVGHHAHCNKHHITAQFRSHKCFCLFQACECYKCTLRLDPRKLLPAASALKREQGPQLKRHMAQELMMSGTTPPKVHSHVKKLAIQAGVLTRKENLPQPEAHPQAASREESSHGALVFNQSPEPLSLPWTLPPLEQQLTVSLSREPHGPPGPPSISSTFQPCAILEPLLLQSQALEASDQALMSAPLEWQRKLEAAEALLTLRNCSWAPSGSISLPQSFGAPAPAENSGLQPPSHSFPRPASSSLPIGHLGCISFLN